jgi:hypothetical protein
MKKVVYSDGLKIKDNKYKEFGKFIINMELLNDNILLIKYKSYAPIPTLRRTTISDDLKDMIYYLFDTGEIDYKQGQKLKQMEKDIFDVLIIKSGLKTQLKYTNLKEPISAVIERFEILKGSIIAGNDNPELIAEIKVVLLKLVEHNKISQNDAEDIIEELIN